MRWCPGVDSIPDDDKIKGKWKGLKLNEELMLHKHSINYAEKQSSQLDRKIKKKKKLFLHLQWLVSYTLLFDILHIFQVKPEATLIYAGCADSQTLFHNDRRPPLRHTRGSSLRPWKLTLGSCFAARITGYHPQTHFARRDPGLVRLLFICKNAKRGYNGNLCLMTPKRRHFCNSSIAKRRSSCEANGQRYSVFCETFHKSSSILEQSALDVNWFVPSETAHFIDVAFLKKKKKA